MTGYPCCRRFSRCRHLPNVFDPFIHLVKASHDFIRDRRLESPWRSVHSLSGTCPPSKRISPLHKKSCLLLTLHYVDQICARTPLFTLSSLTCHRFIIASITVCSKGLCDTFCTNSLYARVGGIPVSELNVLEREFLRMIDWRLTVSTFSLTQPPISPTQPPIRPITPFLLPPSFWFLSTCTDLDTSCTREVLQEYYVNLVRTDSSGRFFITGSPPMAECSISSESDMASRSPSPMQGRSSMDYRTRLTAGMHSPSHHEPSTILIDTTTLTPRAPQAPTLEQNMAFADLQNSLGGGSGIPFARP
ncbi:cyclin-domain-containing protein [Lanmaoa asiatica]|nr:cyclin-domain-containing protein [Lanmaoa asiatica]